MHYENQHFDQTHVDLDGNSFTNCRFTNVVFRYAGGPLDMTDCSMDRFSWQFGGDLARGLHALHQLYGTDLMLTILRGFTDPVEGEIQIPV